MAAPTVTCNAITGSTPTKTTINSRSWSELIIPVSGTAYSAALTKTYTFSGNSASGIKYYLSSVDSNGIIHLLNISTSYTNPATISDATKASWALCPTSLPSTPNLPDCSAGSDTSYITEAKGVTSTSTTGLNVTWVSTLYFLYV